MPGHDFTLQAVMELQKSVGEINANLHAMKSSLDSVKTKVDDLVGIKNKIIGGVAAVAIVGSLFGGLIALAVPYLALKPLPIQVQQPVIPAPAKSASGP